MDGLVHSCPINREGMWKPVCQEDGSWLFTRMSGKLATLTQVYYCSWCGQKLQEPLPLGDAEEVIVGPMTVSGGESLSPA